MRTIALMLCMALLGVATTAQAQDQPRQKPTPQEMATKRTAKLTEALKLDAKQQEQVHALILEHHQQRDKVNNTKLTQDERQNQMKELRKSFDAKLKTVLTPEQVKQYEAKKAEMKNKHGHHKGQHPKDGKKK